MGFFQNLFKGKRRQPSKEPEKTPKRQQNYFLTNSEDFGFGEIQLGISGKLRVDAILAIGALEKIAKERNQAFKFSVMHTSLLEEGALTVPLVCTIGEDKFSVYFIYREEEMLKYLDLRNQVVKSPYPKLMYFSSIPISDHYKPKPIIEPFQLADLRVDKQGKAAGKFAMWWSSDNDPYFHQSKTYEYLQKLCELIKGYETYMAGYVLRQTRVFAEHQLKRVQLPEEHMTYVIDAPEEKKVLLDISQEKGIRFLFPVDGVTQKYRERFLHGALVDFVSSILPLKQQNVPVDEMTDVNSYDWFNFMARVVKEKEVSEQMIGHQIGIVEYNQNMN